MTRNESLFLDVARNAFISFEEYRLNDNDSLDVWLGYLKKRAMPNVQVNYDTIYQRIDWSR